MRTFILTPATSFLFLAVAIVQPDSVARSQQGEATDGRAELLREVDDAWDLRHSVVKSLKVTMEIDESVRGTGKQPLGPPGPFFDRPQEDRLYKVMAEFEFDRGKIRLFRSREKHPDSDGPTKGRSQTLHAAFNGELNSSLLHDGNVKLGTIERKESPNPEMLVHVDFLALGLWLQPKVILRQTAWSIDKMSFDKEMVVVNGIPCRRVHIPRNTRRWTSTLDLDPMQGWAPVQWRILLNGKLKMTLISRFANEDKIGCVLEAWEYTHYDEKGRVETVHRGYVTENQLNLDVDDSRFEIEFPVGTEVSEKLKDGEFRHYLQTRDGLLPVIERKDLPPPRPGDNT